MDERLTMLARNLTTSCGNISVDSLGLFLSKLRKVVPVSLKRICNIVCCLWVTELQDWIVVHCEVLSLLVLTPNLLSLNTKNLHANTSWSWNVVWKELWCE